MRVILLSKSFYQKYGSYKEIMKKAARPYLCLVVTVGGVPYAIPFRHHIHHRYCFHTVGAAGLDFTKCIPLLSQDFISSKRPRIDPVEWDSVKNHRYDIDYRFRQYLHAYKRALDHPDNPRSRNILAYSSLQYFDELFRD